MKCPPADAPGAPRRARGRRAAGLAVATLLVVGACVPGGAQAQQVQRMRPGALRAQLLHPSLSAPELPPGRPVEGSLGFTGLHETARRDTLLQNRPADPWLAFDKVQHATFSFLWTLGSQYTLVNKAAWSERRALPLSIGVSVLVGVGKELYDWRVGSRRYFSRRDLIADAVGILFATGLIVL